MLNTNKALKNTQKIQIVLNDKLSADVVLGDASDVGDCFFDALAQILNKINSTDVNTVKYLRMQCHDFYEKNKELVNQWNSREFGGVYREEDYYFVQYTSDECEKHFKGRSPIWGRPNIEGKILCYQLKLKAICVVEIFEDPETKQPAMGFFLVDEHDYRNVSEKKVHSLTCDFTMPVLVVEQKVCILFHYGDGEC